jgi:O-acetylhomoserine/O-acetylserine sulfhydrylase-like pyridoxal-dependent enzyme
MSPFAAFLILQGLETLSIRVELASWLDLNPAVAWVSREFTWRGRRFFSLSASSLTSLEHVLDPSLPSPLSHKLATEVKKLGQGGMVSFGLQNDSSGTIGDRM